MELICNGKNHMQGPTGPMVRISLDSAGGTASLNLSVGVDEQETYKLGSKYTLNLPLEEAKK